MRRILAPVRLIVALLLVLTTLLPPRGALAQSPERQDAFVYALTAWDGQVYQSTFAPPNVAEIFLLAGAPNVIAPRLTRTYFWPLSNRYEADWLARNEFVDGVLEIRRGNQLVETLAPIDYVMQIDDSQPNAQGQLFTGDAATAAYEAFRAGQAAYRDALYEYAQAYQQYRDEMDRLFASKGATPVAPEALPARPNPVPPYAISSSDLGRGYIVTLEPGTYSMQMRLADGSVLEGSERRLTIFAPLRAGVSYTVMPQERWTAPGIARTENAAIYAPRGGALYLQPFRQALYNDYAWTHLQEPQTDAGRRDRVRWVSYKPIEDASMQIGTDAAAQRIESKGYKVVQLAGSGLGYEVRELAPDSGETPSFVGFAVAPDLLTSPHMTLVDAAGDPLAGSARTLRALRTDRIWMIYAAALLAPLLGGIVLFWRSRQARRVKVLDENMGAWSSAGAVARPRDLNPANGMKGGQP